MSEIVKKNKISKGRKSQKIELFIMGFPFIVLMLIFNYGPVYGWIYAFFNFKPGIPLFQNEFVGLQNFKDIFFHNTEILSILRNTLAFSILGILTTPVSVIIAILLSEINNKTFKKIVQTATTLPNFISWVLVYAVFFFFFSSDGFLNHLLILVGLDGSTNLLGNSEIVWYFQTFVGQWKGAGWGAIIYLAAIAGIDKELFDAAKVDGAGRFQVIRHITIPGMASTFIVLLFLGIANMLSNGFEQYFVFYSSLVAEKIEVLDYYVYRVGILTSDYSMATAIGILKTVISVILLFVCNFIAKRVRGEEII
jgi:putative aldouronate transport system permease protein